MPTTTNSRENSWRPWLWGLAAVLLALPWLAMQFTAEVAWDRADFLVFGAMLALACAGYEAVVRLSSSRKWRRVAATGIAAAFLLVWIELAVGIFD